MKKYITIFFKLNTKKQIKIIFTALLIMIFIPFGTFLSKSGRWMLNFVDERVRGCEHE